MSLPDEQIEAQRKALELLGRKQGFRHLMGPIELSILIGHDQEMTQKYYDTKRELEELKRKKK